MRGRQQRGTRQRGRRVVGGTFVLDHGAVARAVAMGEPCLRNHEVTLGYWELGRRLAVHLGDESANWCTWATWASRTVGHALDAQEEPYLVAERLRDAAPWRRRLMVRVATLSRTALNPRMAPAIADGNREIFDEVADHFLDFLAVLDGDGFADVDAVEQWVKGLVPAPTDELEIGWRFQMYQEAFVAYYRATVEPDHARRAQYVLLGNLLVTDYEQRRLQRYVEEAFFVAPRDLRTVRGWLRLLFGSSVAGLTTRRVTAIITPRFVIPVGTPIALLPGSHSLFPDAFRSPVHDLRTVIDRYPPRRGEGCDNWARFEPRMQYITALFVAYHFEPSLDDAPFTSEAVEALRAALESCGTDTRTDNPAQEINRATRMERFRPRLLATRRRSGGG